MSLLTLDYGTRTAVKMRVLATARELFLQYGIRRVLVDQIASEVRISKKTLYQLFKDKDDLVFQVCELILSHYREHVYQAHLLPVNAIEKILAELEFREGDLREISPALIGDLKKGYPTAWNSFEQFKREVLVGLTESNIRQGIHEGLYRANVAVRVLAEMRAQHIEAAYDPSWYEHSKSNALRIHQQMTYHFLYGLSTPKGHALIDQYTRENQ